MHVLPWVLPLAWAFVGYAEARPALSADHRAAGRVDRTDHASPMTPTPTGRHDSAALTQGARGRRLAPPGGGTVNGIPCVDRDSFVSLSFHDATVVHSNLGGLGGQCGIKVFDCDENEVTDATPHEMLLRGVGVNNVGPAANDEVIDLRITNTSEYRHWTPNTNGIKRGEDDTSNTDAFAVINLLQPRSVAQGTSQWNRVLTITQFKFEFITGSSQTPLWLQKTYLSFWDYDESLAEEEGEMIMEAIQPDENARLAFTANGTEVEEYPAWTLSDGGFVNATAVYESYREVGASMTEEEVTLLIREANHFLGPSWPTPVLTSGSFGVGGDNPVDPLAPTTLQKQRAVMFMYENVSTFEVRFAIHRCCGKGRNFMIGGFSPLRLEIKSRCGPGFIFYYVLP